jgi:hypothetical protein
MGAFPTRRKYYRRVELRIDVHHATPGIAGMIGMRRHRRLKVLFLRFGRITFCQKAA